MNPKFCKKYFCTFSLTRDIVLGGKVQIQVLSSTRKHFFVLLYVYAVKRPINACMNPSDIVLLPKTYPSEAYRASPRGS